jgi:broad specificity phosphatase PhoE
MTTVNPSTSEKSSKTLWLMRHSIRADKINPELYVGWNDCEITNEGYQLAAEHTDVLMDNIDTKKSVLILSSPYKRTIQTAYTVQAKMAIYHLDLQVDGNLAEAHDISTYPTKPVYGDQLKDFLENTGIKYPETLDELNHRTDALLEKVKGYFKNYDVIILVTHGAVYNSILSHIIPGYDLLTAQQTRPYSPTYCQLTKVTYDKYRDELNVVFSQAPTVNKFLEKN